MVLSNLCEWFFVLSFCASLVLLLPLLIPLAVAPPPLPLLLVLGLVPTAPPLRVLSMLGASHGPPLPLLHAPPLRA